MPSMLRSDFSSRSELSLTVMQAVGGAFLRPDGLSGVASQSLPEGKKRYFGVDK
jgi:hypothetical protein